MPEGIVVFCFLSLSQTGLRLSRLYYNSQSSLRARIVPPLESSALWDMESEMWRGVAVSKERCRTWTRFPCGLGRLVGHWLRGEDLVPLFPAPSDTIAAPSKMAAATADPGAGSPQAGDSSGGGAGGGLPSPGEQELSRRLQRLYPAVNQHETPLPRSWSPKDKYNYIGLSQGNLRVHYKGIGLFGPGGGGKHQSICRAAMLPCACPITSLPRPGCSGLGLGPCGVSKVLRLTRPRVDCLDCCALRHPMLRELQQVSKPSAGVDLTREGLLAYTGIAPIPAGPFITA